MTVNSPSGAPYFFFQFFNAVWALTSSGFCIVSDCLFMYYVRGEKGREREGERGKAKGRGGM